MFAARAQLLRKRLDRFTRALRGVDRGDVRSLHRARVASRRLRELVPVLQLDQEVARKLGRRLRKVTVRLGAVRELDVVLLVIDELHDSRRQHREPLSRVAVAVAKERDDARARLLERLPVDDMRRIARKLDRVAGALEAADAARPRTAAARTWRWAVDARVARRASALGAAIDEAGAVYLAERLHAVRIALKKLRYALELAEEIAGEKPSPDLRALKRAQEILGRLHDLQVLIDRVRQVQASLTPPSLTMWRALDALVVDLDVDCRQLHARYMRVRGDLEAITGRLSHRTPDAGPQSRRVAG